MLINNDTIIFETSIEIDNIFDMLKTISKNDAKNDSTSKFKTELARIKNTSHLRNLEDFNNYKISLPTHGLVETINTNFENFTTLFDYMYRNRNFNLLIPYIGKDALQKIKEQNEQ